MIKLVAFDWNGTLFADTHAIYESNEENFKLLNIKPVSFRAFQKYFDVPVKRFYLALGVSEEELDRKISQIAQTFHSHYEILAAKARSRAYAKELLSWLIKNNVRSVIFSNHILEPIQKQLKRLKIDQFFSEVIANSHLESALQDRSKKERLKSYLNQHKFLVTETLIIGDTVEEIEIGKELGITTAAITGGNCSIARLKMAKPDYLIHNLKEVIDILKKLNYITYGQKIIIKSSI